MLDLIDQEPSLFAYVIFAHLFSVIFIFGVHKRLSGSRDPFDFAALIFPGIIVVACLYSGSPLTSIFAANFASAMVIWGLYQIAKNETGLRGIFITIAGFVLAGFGSLIA